MDNDNNTPVEIPDDLTGLSAAELDALEQAAVTEFDRLSAADIDAASLERCGRLADAIDAVRAERSRRADEAQQAIAQRDALRQRIHGTPAEDDTDTTDSDQNGDGTPAAEDDTGTGEGAAEVPQLAEAVAAAVTAALTAANGGHYSPARTQEREAPRPRLNPSLADVQRHAPAVQPPEHTNRPTIVAGAHIPGVETGAAITSRRQLAEAMMARARNLPNAAGTGWENRTPLATLQRRRAHVIEQNASKEQVADALTAAVARGADMESLVAAGGWCAPNERSYDFFNVVDTSGTGMLDLPTISVSRGGIEWPVSPTYADIVDGSTGLWTWTETQDIAAATGTGQSGTKTCVRISCADTASARMDCDGLCVVNGNLMAEAWPEAVENFLSVMDAGYDRRINGLRIRQLVAGSTSVTFAATGTGVVAPVLNSMELQAIDYRARFRMARDAVLEAVAPEWLRGAMRADLMYRNGVDMLEVADQRLMSMFDARGIRVQWVRDWQDVSTGYPGGSAPLTAWPSTVQIMLYAPGTWVLGEGMSIDLGVIRDSTLNETNDYTAAWKEECWLIAKKGHESRRITIPICPNGNTGAAGLTGCLV